MCAFQLKYSSIFIPKDFVFSTLLILKFPTYIVGLDVNWLNRPLEPMNIYYVLLLLRVNLFADNQFATLFKSSLNVSTISFISYIRVRFRFSGLMSNKLCHDVSNHQGGARQSTVSNLHRRRSYGNTFQQSGEHKRFRWPTIAGIENDLSQ